MMVFNVSSHEPESMKTTPNIKYILIEHADGNDPKQLRIFDNVADRATATREAILGPPDAHNKDMQCPDLLILADEGRVDFEGDPSLEWIDAEVDIITSPVAPPPAGSEQKCLVCEQIKPWGVFDSATGVSVCVECRNAARSVTGLRLELKAVKSRESRLLKAIPFPGLTGGNAGSIAYRLERGENNGGLTTAALAEYLRSFESMMSRYAKAVGNATTP